MRPVTSAGILLPFRPSPASTNLLFVEEDDILEESKENSPEFQAEENAQDEHPTGPTDPTIPKEDAEEDTFAAGNSPSRATSTGS